MSEVNNSNKSFEFENEMKIVEMKGVIRETERRLAHCRCITDTPDCEDLGELIRNISEVEKMIAFIKNKAMQILDEK